MGTGGSNPPPSALIARLAPKEAGLFLFRLASACYAPGNSLFLWTPSMGACRLAAQLQVSWIFAFVCGVFVSRFLSFKKS